MKGAFFPVPKTNTAIAAQITTLERLGLNYGSLQELHNTSNGKALVLRFVLKEKCEFVKETAVNVEDPSVHVNAIGIGSIFGLHESKVVTKVKEYQ